MLAYLEHTVLPRETQDAAAVPNPHKLIQHACQLTRFSLCLPAIRMQQTPIQSVSIQMEKGWNDRPDGGEGRADDSTVLGN